MVNARRDTGGLTHLCHHLLSIVGTTNCRVGAESGWYGRGRRSVIDRSRCTQQLVQIEDKRLLKPVEKTNGRNVVVLGTQWGDEAGKPLTSN